MGKPDWQSYDSVAGTYARVAEPSFRAMARDLIDSVRLGRGDRVLDLGTGTGLVAGLAWPLVAPDGLIVGVDPSLSMVSHIHPRPALAVIAAQAPGLPLRDASVDVVLANLVLSHLPDLALGMTDIARVIRPGGRLGATAWAGEVPGGPENDRPEADAIVDEIKRHHGLDIPLPADGPVRFEDTLRELDELTNRLAQAGLTDIVIERHRYDWTFTIEDFLSGWGGQGRYLRHAFGRARWDRFVDEAAVALRSRFGEAVRWVGDIHIALGTRGP